MDSSSVLHLIYKADFDNALESVNSMEEDNYQDYLLLKSRILELKGDYSGSMDLVDKLQDIVLEDQYDMIFCSNIQRSYIHYRLRQATEATDYLDKSSAILDKIKTRSEKVVYFESIRNNLSGNLRINRGDLEDALNYYHRSIEIKKDLKDNFGISIIQNNIGEVYRTRGNFEKAEKYFNQSIEYSEELITQSYAAAPNLNLGLLQSQLGNYSASLEYLMHAHNMTNYLRYPVFLGYILYQLVVVNIRMDRKAEAKGHFGDLQQLKSQIKNDMINLLYNASNAFILKNGERSKDKVEAQMIFEEIVHDRVIDHEITVFARMNLCQLLLDELKLYGNEEVFKDIKDHIAQLEEIARSQNSNRLLAETFLIQSKLALIDLNLSKAKRLLSQALFLADENGYHNLAFQISKEMDNLVENERIFNNLREQEKSLIDRLDYVDFEDIVDNVMYRNLFREEDLVSEEPKLLLIIDEGGVVRYTLNLGGSDKIKENLVGAFFSAINSFLNDAFSIDSQIELIKYGKYKIIMKQQGELLFCYVFEGTSYQAAQKVDLIIEYFLGEQEIWDQMSGPIDKLADVPEDVREELLNLIHNK